MDLEEFKIWLLAQINEAEKERDSYAHGETLYPDPKHDHALGEINAYTKVLNLISQ